MKPTTTFLPLACLTLLLIAGCSKSSSAPEQTSPAARIDSIIIPQVVEYPGEATFLARISNPENNDLDIRWISYDGELAEVGRLCYRYSSQCHHDRRHHLRHLSRRGAD